SGCPRAPRPGRQVAGRTQPGYSADPAGGPRLLSVAEGAHALRTREELSDEADECGKLACQEHRTARSDDSESRDRNRRGAGAMSGKGRALSEAAQFAPGRGEDRDA